MDVFVDKDSEKVAVEVESLYGTKDVVHAVQNAVTALEVADQLEIVVTDMKAAKRLRKALKQSPVKKDKKIKIYQLDHYKSQ